MYKSEIDEVLTRHLGRVRAPEELLARMENPDVRVSTNKTQRISVPLAIAAMAGLSFIVFHPRPAIRGESNALKGTVEIEFRMPEHNLTLRVSKSAVPAEALNAACGSCHTGA